MKTMRLVRRYPRVGGLLLVVAGAIMTWESVQLGKAVARFAGGALVDGRVVSVEDAGDTVSDFKMTVAWTDATGVQRTARTDVFKYEFEHFTSGDTVELLVANDDPGL